MSRIKKFLLSVGGVLVGASAFAEGEAGAIDLSAATNALTSAKTAIVAWVTSNAPTLSGILGGVLVITLIFVVYGWVRRAAKGR